MSERTALVTGIGGFVGGFLAEHLAEHGVRVVGTVRPGAATQADMPRSARIEVLEADLNDFERVAAVIAQTRPDLIFHLAAQSIPAHSWNDPARTLVDNVIMELAVLQGVLAAKIRPRIVVVCSNEEYGAVRPDELPIRETNELRPMSPYAVSKVAQDMLAYQYSVSHGLHCIRVRPFNHTGPRQSDALAVPAFARQVAEAEAGLREPVIRVGNLDSRRDFTDVRDIVRGYYLAAQQGLAGEVYNLGSGRAVSMREALEFFVAHSRRPVAVQQDPALQRPADLPITICDYSKFHALTGWRPEIPIEHTFADTLEFWRGRVSATSAR